MTTDRPPTRTELLASLNAFVDGKADIDANAVWLALAEDLDERHLDDQFGLILDELRHYRIAETTLNRRRGDERMSY